MNKFLADTRRKLQLALNSRFGQRQPSILVNSIPKSGTHLIKAILDGNGYQFVGHYNGPEIQHIKMNSNSDKKYSTAHTQIPVTGPGMRLLVFRDPCDVAVSMALYVRARVDHPMNRRLNALSLEGAIDAIFDGSSGINSLSLTYQNRLNWARASQARGIDFNEFIKKPNVVFSTIGEANVDILTVKKSMQKWNPTKRTKKHPQEKELKEALRASNNINVRETHDLYKAMQQELLG